MMITRALLFITQTTVSLVLVFWLAIFSAHIYWFFAAGNDWEQLALVFAIVATAWFPFEYCMHRFLFHIGDLVPKLQLFSYAIHGYHHDYPNDSRRLLFPIPYSLAIYAMISIVCRKIFQNGTVDAILASIIFDYLLYDLLHYRIHIGGEPRTNLMRALIRHHWGHHHNRYTNFSVTMPVIDVVGMTNRQKNR
jgi:Fatty acid hydroxylase superfamily